jgi:gamma-glutamyltranspeptidase
MWSLPNHPNIPPKIPSFRFDHPLNLEPALDHTEQGFVVSGGILAADEKNRSARFDLSRPEDEAYFAANGAQLANEVVERLLAEMPVD